MFSYTGRHITLAMQPRPGFPQRNHLMRTKKKLKSFMDNIITIWVKSEVAQLASFRRILLIGDKPRRKSISTLMSLQRSPAEHSERHPATCTVCTQAFHRVRGLRAICPCENLRRDSASRSSRAVHRADTACAARQCEESSFPISKH